MKCLKCKAELERQAELDIVLTLPMRTPDGRQGERDFQGVVAGTRCTGCGDTVYSGTDLREFERLVAVRLSSLGVSTGGELRFLRKVAGFRAVDLASHLGVSAETVSHWETGRTRPDASTFAMVVQLCRAELAAASGTPLPAPLAPKELLGLVRAPDQESPIQLPPLQRSA